MVNPLALERPAKKPKFGQVPEFTGPVKDWRDYMEGPLTMADLVDLCIALDNDTSLTIGDLIAVEQRLADQHDTFDVDGVDCV